MSTEAMALALNHSAAKGTTKLVLIGIANHDGEGGAWPSIRTLAKVANCTERSVQRAIGELVELGEIRVHLNAGGTHKTANDRRPNRYDVLITCPETCDRTTRHRQIQAVENPTNGVTHMSPREAHGVTPVTQRGDVGVAHGVTPTSPEPSLNHPRTTPTLPDDVDRLTSLLASEGVRGPDVLERIVRISADAGSDHPVARLLKVRHHRLACIEQLRADQATERSAALQAEPRCAECKRPESICRAAEAKTPAEYRHHFTTGEAQAS